MVRRMSASAVNVVSDRREHARKLLWPVAIATLLFTVSYPANDYLTASKPSDIGLGKFLVYAGIAIASTGIIFGLVLPWAMRRENSGGIALGLAIVGTLMA